MSFISYDTVVGHKIRYLDRLESDKEKKRREKGKWNHKITSHVPYFLFLTTLTIEYKTK